MQVDGSTDRAAAELFEVKEVLIDIPGGEAQMIADFLERMAAGVADHGQYDDGENMIVMYLMADDESAEGE